MSTRPSVGGKDAVLVIDDTAMPKKGDRSVGVAPQYASSLGKTANCQTLVSLTLARGEVPVMVALRLFVPESWTSNPVRSEACGRSSRAPRGADQAGDRLGGDRSRDGRRYALWLCAGGCRLRPQRALPSGAHDTRPCLGRWYPASPQGVPGRGKTDLAGCYSGSSPQAAHSGYPVEGGRRHAGQRQVAKCELAKRRPRVGWKRASPRFACGPPMDLRSGSRTRASSTFQEMKRGSSVNTGYRERRNIISPICQPRRICAR